MPSENELKTYTAQELFTLTQEQPDWIVADLVPAGALVDISAPPKAGKTTYLLQLAKAVMTGSLFLNRPTRQTNVLYLTEQPVASFKKQLGDAGLSNCGNELEILLWRDVRKYDWPSTVHEVGRICRTRKQGLIIVDTFPQFARLEGDQENNSGAVLAALRPLQEVRDDLGASFQLSRHDRKQGGTTVDAGRGSSAYAGAMDVLFGLRRENGRAASSNPNVRVLNIAGRYNSIPETLSYQLTSGGLIACDNSHGTVGHTQAGEMLEMLLRNAPEPGLTVDQLIQRSSTSRGEIQRLLDELNGRVIRCGTGVKGTPFTYRILE